MIAAALTRHHPDWISRDGAWVRNRLTESWEVRSVDALELAGRLVQEDLCLIQNDRDRPVFTAAMLCFPSWWRLTDKIGKPLSAVHEPVPLYQEWLAKPVDRFMRHLKPGHIVSRLNWSMLDDPALFLPRGKWPVDGDSGITVENAGERVFLRVERQTLRRLPTSGAVLFGIRVHVYPLTRAIDRPDRATALAEAVRALPAEVQHYRACCLSGGVAGRIPRGPRILDASHWCPRSADRRRKRRIGTTPASRKCPVSACAFDGGRALKAFVRTVFGHIFRKLQSTDFVIIAPRFRKS